MVQNPIIRDDPSVELAHKALPNVIHAVLIVSLVQLRHTLLFVLRLGEIVHMMVLPDVVHAVQLVRADRRSDVAAARFGWELRRPVGVSHFVDVLLGDANEANYATVQLVKCYRCTKFKEQISIGLHFMISYQAFSTSGVGGPLKGLWYHSEPLNCRWT